MHVHAYHSSSVRTTIEIRDEQRAKLLKLAAQRGEKGFSRLVEEALDRFLDENAERGHKVQQALSVLGSLSDAAGDRLEESVRQIRGTWR